MKELLDLKEGMCKYPLLSPEVGEAYDQKFCGKPTGFKLNRFGESVRRVYCDCHCNIVFKED